MISLLYKLLESFRNGTKSCSFECDSILLGALIKEMQIQPLFSEQLAVPFLGLSVAATTEAIQALRSPNWCSWTGSGKRSQKHSCDFSEFTNPVIDGMADEMKGLTLKMYTGQEDELVDQKPVLQACT
jgi:hypothetical protein